jgi:hypothetical protein
VIAAQNARDYVANAKKDFDAADPQYGGDVYKERLKKYREEYVKQLMRLANSIGRINVEEKVIPGSFYDEQVVVTNMPPEYQELFRNPMVRSTFFEEFITAITAAQRAGGSSEKYIENTTKWAADKRKEAIDSGASKWGASNLNKVEFTTGLWDPVVMAALRGLGFPQISYLGSSDQVREIAPWLSNEYSQREAAAHIKLIVGNFIADKLGLSASSAISQRAVQEYIKAKEEARRKADNIKFVQLRLRQQAQEAEAARKKAEAEGRTSDEARYAEEKAKAETAAREATARAEAAERAAQEANARAEAAERAARDAASASSSSSASSTPTAPPAGGSAPVYSEGSSAMTAPGADTATTTAAATGGGGGGAITPPPAESLAPVVTTDATGAPAVVVPDSSVVAPAVVVPPPMVPGSKPSPVVALLAVAAISGGIWWYMKNRRA